ncbi:MAG TPA: hypothetical protein VFZ59_20625 [Verrucomicrobiae bacterium]|nr:hypothetical protein [Verrucomicrobiae bacterium]
MSGPSHGRNTQVYSNTGGQSSTATFMGQNTKFTVHGKAILGKIERRKELAQICMVHPNTFVAQTGLCHPLPLPSSSSPILNCVGEGGGGGEGQLVQR